MTGRFRHLTILAIAAAAVVWLGSPAHAGFSLTVSEGTASITFTDATPLGVVTGSGGASGTLLATGQNGIDTATLKVGDFTVAFEVSTNNSPGKPDPATISILNSTVTNKATTTGNKTLTITEKTTGGSFTSPTALSGILDVGLTTTAFVGAGTVSDTSGIVGGTQLSPPSITGPNVSKHTEITGLAPIPHPFDLSQTLTYSLAKGTSVTTSDASTTLTAAPAPAGLILASIGAPLCGLAGWLRRRKTVA